MKIGFFTHKKKKYIYIYTVYNFTIEMYCLIYYILNLFINIYMNKYI